jgi:hypothetical protein
MSPLHHERIAALASRIEAACPHVAGATSEIMLLVESMRHAKLSRADLIDAIEDAAGYDLASGHAMRIAEAVLTVMRRRAEERREELRRGDEAPSAWY